MAFKYVRRIIEIIVGLCLCVISISSDFDWRLKSWIGAIVYGQVVNFKISFFCFLDFGACGWPPRSKIPSNFVNSLILYVNFSFDPPQWVKYPHLFGKFHQFARIFRKKSQPPLNPHKIFRPYKKFKKFLNTPLIHPIVKPLDCSSK